MVSGWRRRQVARRRICLRLTTCKTRSAHHEETPMSNAKRGLTSRGVVYNGMRRTALRTCPALFIRAGVDPWWTRGITWPGVNTWPGGATMGGGSHPRRRHCLYSPKGRMRVSVHQEIVIQLVRCAYGANQDHIGRTVVVLQPICQLLPGGAENYGKESGQADYVELCCISIYVRS